MVDDEKTKQENPAKLFWSGLNYIIDTLAGSGVEDKSDLDDPTFDIHHKSITLSIGEWRAIEKHYGSLEKALLDTWEDAVQLADDLDEMKGLHPDDIEAYRKSDQTIAESILARLENFVDNDKVEV